MTAASLRIRRAPGRISHDVDMKQWRVVWRSPQLWTILAALDARN
ncbi:MAG TPA: hypothetical protein VJS63_14155 [Bradyrhizobium sp.]|nr:hypothetical protein [Bradyrhizobium sp.]